MTDTSTDGIVKVEFPDLRKGGQQVMCCDWHGSCVVSGGVSPGSKLL